MDTARHAGSAENTRDGSSALSFDGQMAFSLIFSFIPSLHWSCVFSVLFTKSTEAIVTAAGAHEMEDLKRQSLGGGSDGQECWLQGQ